jgi:hypothetical protein
MVRSKREREIGRQHTAIHTITYACGIAPWKPNQGPAVATPTIALDLLKEGQTWMINGFL